MQAQVSYLGCTDCHGGNADVFAHEGAEHSDYDHAMEEAHVLPSYPEDWNFPHSRNPEVSYALLNKEAKEFVRFVNPSDLRVAKEACGACHLEIVQAAKRSIMATGAMLFGAATYANNVLPFKNYISGEAYTPDGEPSAIKGPPLKDAAKAQKEYGVLPMLSPIPSWETGTSRGCFQSLRAWWKKYFQFVPGNGTAQCAGIVAAN
jgi:hypothetical protein